METTRRNFIQTAGWAAALLFAGGFGRAFGQKNGGGDLFEIPAEAYSSPIFSMSAKQLEPYIGSFFAMTSEDGRTIRLVLTEVNQLERSANTIRGYYGDTLSMIFEGPERHILVQGTYEVSGDGLSPFTALVVPTGRRQRQYELIINRVTR